LQSGKKGIHSSRASTKQIGRLGNDRPAGENCRR
jgi:hypothetical protein